MMGNHEAVQSSDPLKLTQGGNINITQGGQILGLPAEPAPATQTAHPWRATVRTVFAFLIGLAAAWVLIIQALGLSPDIPWVATSLIVAAGITRVMALPSVDDLIRRFAPWLAPDKP